MDGKTSIQAASRDKPGCGHFSIDAERRILAWDAPAARLLGIPQDAALGRPCECVVGGGSDFGRAVCGSRCPAWKALSAGSIAGSARVVVRAADGARLRLACDLTALPAGGALGRLRPAEELAPDLAYDLAGIAALTSKVSGEPLQRGLRDALDFLLQVTGADAGEAFLAEPHGRGVVRSCHRGRFAHAFDQILRFDSGQGFPGLVLAHGQSVYTDHLQEEGRFLRTQVKRQGFRTYACTALTGGGDALGCLALAFRRGDVDLRRVLNLLRGVSTPMGLVVETALAHQREAATVPLRGVEGDPEHRLPEALRTLLQEMVSVGGADGGDLFLPWQGGELQFSLPDAAVMPRCPVLSADALGRCPSFGTGSISILHDRRTAWSPACHEAVRPGGAWCCIPLSCNGESLGMIRLRYRHLRPSAPNETVALVERLAELVAEKVRDVRNQSAHDNGTGSAFRTWLQRDVQASGATGTVASRPVRSLESGSAPAPAPAPALAAERDAGVRLEIRCLGSLELSVDGVRLATAAVPRKRVLTLLGILLTHHDHPLCKDALIEMLWPGADPDVRARQLHVLVHELRKVLEPQNCAGNWLYLRKQADRYLFDTCSPCWIDMLEFRALIELGRKAEAAHEEPAAIGAYEAAVELYRGDYMQDEPFADWCWQAREHLRETCLGVLSRLAALWGGQERWDRSIVWSRRALLLDPLREEMHRALMYALWASGRRDEAVRQYEACAHLLRERLDLVPLPETEQLFARIRARPRPHPGH